MINTNKIYTHPGQPEMQVEVILASAASNCPNLYTIRMRYPRVIHGEIMTHRVFSRNARSSRAVPVLTMLEEVRKTPYVPWHWGKNQKGMQAFEENNTPVVFGNGEDNFIQGYYTREEAWLKACNNAVNIAEAFMEADYHKQNPNRLLEPFSWIDTLITATQWDNFLWLRQHHAAEPHLQDLANLVAKAIAEAEIQNLTTNDWHLPYITEHEIEIYHNSILLRLSAARCARISYKPFNGDSTIEAELNRYNSLMADDRVHASPLEHQGKPDYKDKHGYTLPHYHGNFTGWIQQRKLVPNEVYQGK